MRCPRCDYPLRGLGTYCEPCQDYVDNLAASTTDTTPEARERIKDDRLEAQIQNATVKALEMLGFTVYSMSQDRPTRQTPGIADLFLCGWGVCAWAEMKTQNGTQSDDQKDFERHVTENGGTYLLWRHESEAIRWAEAVRQGRAA